MVGWPMSRTAAFHAAMMFQFTRASRRSSGSRLSAGARWGRISSRIPATVASNDAPSAIITSGLAAADVGPEARRRADDPVLVSRRDVPPGVVLFEKLLDRDTERQSAAAIRSRLSSASVKRPHMARVYRRVRWSSASN